jgi:pimeloyl-ACP methyl ester carboxylesterase
MLDWSSAANTGLLFPEVAEDAILPVAEWAANALRRFEFVGTNLNLVGHSFGSYVADEIARRIPGGVNTIVTLDPAADVFGGYSPVGPDGVEFARDSFFSWSFHSSSLGNDQTPTTADESFIVNSDQLFPNSAHSAVAFLFAYMVLHPDDPVAQFFLLNSLLTATTGPWLPDQYPSSFALGQNVKGYEAVITSTNQGTEPLGLRFTKLPLLSIAKASQGIAVSWPAFYDTFLLEVSRSAGTSAAWAPVQSTPSVVGSSKVLLFPGTETMFFRLKQP